MHSLFYFILYIKVTFYYYVDMFAALNQTYNIKKKEIGSLINIID